MRRHRLATLVGIGLCFFVSQASAKSKHHKPELSAPSDSIEVIGHIPLMDDPITRFVSTRHYSSYYLYAEHTSGGSVTLIDVTKAAEPSVLADVPYAPEGDSEGLVVVAGTAALVSDEQTRPTVVSPQTLRIMDFSDAHRPKVAREFTGVTAIGKDDGRGLVFIANEEGIWILQQRFAEDPQVEAEFTKRVLYDH